MQETTTELDKLQEGDILKSHGNEMFRGVAVKVAMRSTGRYNQIANG